MKQMHRKLGLLSLRMVSTIPSRNATLKGMEETVGAAEIERKVSLSASVISIKTKEFFRGPGTTIASFR